MVAFIFSEEGGKGISTKGMASTKSPRCEMFGLVAVFAIEEDPTKSYQLLLFWSDLSVAGTHLPFLLLFLLPSALCPGSLSG